MIRLCHILISIYFLGFGVLVSCEEANYPSKPIKLIIPYGTGTGVDIFSRTITAALSDRLKQQVFIENKPGMSAIVGVTALKNSVPDGYTLGILVSANAAQPWLIKDIAFDIRRDFAPIVMLYEGPLVLTVNKTFPADNLDEFIKYAKANPNKLFYGSLGVGTTTHLAAEMLLQVAGIKATHVPYKGSGEIHASVAAQEIQFSFDNYISPRPLVDAGRLKAIVSTGKKRANLIPNVPLMSETYPGVELNYWTGIAAPLTTPKSIIEKVNFEVQSILKSPTLIAKLNETGSEVGGGSPADFDQRIKEDYDRFGRIIKTAGIKAE
jgi:tripartite-type tricarboxylate transporter receptor subunit TctC